VREMESKNMVIDQLILNAGIAEEKHPHVNPSDTNRDELLHLFDVNVSMYSLLLLLLMLLLKESLVGWLSRAGDWDQCRHAALPPFREEVGYQEG